MKKKTQFTVWSLLMATTVVAVVYFATMTIIEMRSILDFTGRRTNVCEVHGLKMQKQLVGMTYGMPVFKLDGEPEEEARRTSFPHADEPYRTGYCCPTVQTKARVYVCPECSLAHKAWFGKSSAP